MKTLFNTIVCSLLIVSMYATCSQASTTFVVQDHLNVPHTFVVQDQVTIRGDTAQVDTIIDQTLLGGYYITKQECYAGDKIFFNQITEYDRFAGAYMCDKAEWYYHETPSTPYNITKPQLTLNPL